MTNYFPYSFGTTRLYCKFTLKFKCINMKRYTFFLIFISLGLYVSAQGYTTPNTGVNWNLDSLLQYSPGTVTFSNDIYQITQDLTIAENDTLSLSEGVSIMIDEDIRITTEGVFYSLGAASDEILITATDSLTPYNGFRFEEISKVKIGHTIIKNGGGLKVITPNFTLTHSTLSYNVSGVATGAVVSLSHGAPLIQNNTFVENQLPAVSSPANHEVSAHILDNYIESNVQSNQNRPQINMGPTGVDTLKIIGNTIMGDRDLDQVGGIAVSNLLGTGQVTTVIEGNTIIDNRYGITVAGGNAYAKIIGNIIENNDTQGLPNLGGSGISLNSSNDSQTIIATGNEIRNNLWGITLIGKASINLGDDIDNPGNNIFAENGNGNQVYALYNNTPNTILAKHNCWIEGQVNTLADAANVIFDQADDATLGEVIYDPVGCDILSLSNSSKDNTLIYPNPTTNQLQFSSDKSIDKVIIFSLNGKQVAQTKLSVGQNSIPLNVDHGIYIVRFISGNIQTNRKLIVE